MKITDLKDISSSFELKGKIENTTIIPSPGKFKLTATKKNNKKEFLCNLTSVSNVNYTLKCDNPRIINNLDLKNTIAEINEGGKRNEKLIIKFSEEVQSKIRSSSYIGSYYNKSKKKGLSTGGTIAIIILCIIVLLGALALAFMLNRNPNPSPKLINNNKVGISSSKKYNLY